MKPVILDRDGVINQDSEHHVRSPDEWTPIPDSLKAIVKLNRHDFRVIVVSNQSGLDLGLFDIQALNAIHKKMHDQLNELGGHVDAVFFCPHAENRRCGCRKPRTALYESIQERLRISLRGVPCVGDKASDMAAARQMGGQPFLVRTGYGRAQAQQAGEDIQAFDNLAAVVRHLCA